MDIDILNFFKKIAFEIIDFLKFVISKDSNTFWTAAQGVGTVLTFLLLIYPIIKKRRNLKKQQKRIVNFNKKFSENKSKLINLYIHDFDSIQSGLWKNYKEKCLSFYQNQCVVLNNCSDLIIDNINIPQGYHLYSKVSDVCIKIEFINSENKIKSIYLFKNNHVPKFIKIHSLSAIHEYSYSSEYQSCAGSPISVEDLYKDMNNENRKIYKADTGSTIEADITYILNERNFDTVIKWGSKF
jgi:hypothetical protein